MSASPPPLSSSSDSERQEEELQMSAPTIALGQEHENHALKQKYVTELYFQDHSQSFKILATLSCGGLQYDNDDEDSPPLLDMDGNPWDHVFGQRKAKPLASDLRAEIFRRWLITHPASPPDDSPRTAAWTIPKLLAWLKQNPLTGADDIDFLRRNVAAQKEVIQQGIADEQLQEMNLNNKNTSRLAVTERRTR
jgi:hypothetical protein